MRQAQGVPGQFGHTFFRALRRFLCTRHDAKERNSRFVAARPALLEIWLVAHVPLYFALIAALIAQVISVFYYW